MSSTHRRRFLVFFALCLGAAAAVVPAVASEDGTTITIGASATLVARVEVDIHTVVNCAPLPAPASQMSSINLEEAVSKSSIARGSGFFPVVTCDGADHAVTAIVFADSSGPPFKRGQAVVTFASINVCTSSFPVVCEGGSAGPQVVSIHG